jgi:hypothetical protein
LASFNAPKVQDTTATYQTLGVTFYNEADYGSYPNFRPLTLDVGEYNEEFFASKMFKDNIGSIKIPHGYEVTVYQNNFSGDSAIYDSNQASVISSISSVKIARKFDPIPNNLVLSEVKLVHNPNTANESPLEDGITPLPCTNNPSGIQSYGVTNTYAGSPVTKGILLNLAPRIRAAVRYTEALEGSPLQEKTSHAAFLRLAAPETSYRCAGKMQVDIKNSKTQVGGEYDGQMSIEMCLNTNGMGDEGISTFSIVLGQDGDYTDETDVTGGDGVQVALEFSASDAVVPTYASQADASGSIADDKIKPGETVTLAVTDVDGLNEPAAGGNWFLKSGDQTESDVSTVIFPAGNGFDASRPIKVFAVVATRVSLDTDIKENAGYYAEAILGIYITNKLFAVDFSVEGGRDPRLANNTDMILLIDGGSSGRVTPMSVTKITGRENVYRAICELPFYIAEDATSLDYIYIMDGNTTLSWASNLNFGSVAL